MQVYQVLSFLLYSDTIEVNDAPKPAPQKYKPSICAVRTSSVDIAVATVVNSNINATLLQIALDCISSFLP